MMNSLGPRKLDRKVTVRMKNLLSIPSAVLLFFGYSGLFAQDLYIGARGRDVLLQIDPHASVPDRATQAGTFEIESSPDLKHWIPFRSIDVNEAYQYHQGMALRATEDDGGEQNYFRIAELPRVQYTTDDAEVYFGYARAMSEELGKRHLAEPHDLLAAYPPRSVGETIDWDPTAAEFWNRFMTNPSEANAALGNSNNEGESGGEADEGLRRYTDYRLNEPELAAFKKNGFVVSERLGTQNFVDSYYNLWRDHMPVYITGDSMLQAWQFTFRSMLKHMEANFLTHHLGNVLAGVGTELETVDVANAGPRMQVALADAKVWVSVAQSLLKGTTISIDPEDIARVEELLQKVQAEQFASVELFGRSRVVDFSQFKPRSHYTNTEELKRYFRAIIWCGRIDFRLTKGNQYREQPLEELGAAALFAQALHTADRKWVEEWRMVDTPIRSMVGWADSMTPIQLYQLLDAEGKGQLGSLTDEDLSGLVEKILAGELGFQNILSHYYVSPMTPERIVMPRAMTFLGQRFALDSWAMGQVVFDNIVQGNVKVMRRIPSSLDIAFSTFGNNAALPIIVDRMVTPGRPFRDGLPYQDNLAAVRAVVDSQSTESWQDTIYNRWLWTLRALSHDGEPSGGETTLPETMRTEAWQIKDMNTQLASWTHLRHATVAYVKQSYTGGAGCDFPAAFVEPQPEFWRRFGEMSDAYHAFLEDMAFPDRWRLTAQSHMLHFSEVLGKLEALARKQAGGEAFTEEDMTFIRGLVEVRLVDNICVQVRVYSGWYPRLYFPDSTGATSFRSFDAMITDVHTDVPAPDFGDPGTVLHQGVGGANLMLAAIERGGKLVAYAGPVLSHYEYDPGRIVRLTDEEWTSKLFQERIDPPEWTECYLVR